MKHVNTMCSTIYRPKHFRYTGRRVLSDCLNAPYRTDNMYVLLSRLYRSHITWTGIQTHTAMSDSWIGMSFLGETVLSKNTSTPRDVTTIGHTGYFSVPLQSADLSTTVQSGTYAMSLNLQVSM
jgi:hypothetical protein